MNNIPATMYLMKHKYIYIYIYMCVCVCVCVCVSGFTMGMYPPNSSAGAVGNPR